MKHDAVDKLQSIPKSIHTQAQTMIHTHVYISSPAVYITCYFDSIYVGFSDAVSQRDDISDLCSGHIFSLPPVHRKKKLSISETWHLKLLLTRNLPECVSNSILKVDEIVCVDGQQVPSVEEHVSFLKDIVKLLLLWLLQVSSITTERSPGCYFRHQQTRLTWVEDRGNHNRLN